MTRLSIEEAGEGTPVVLLHGLSATRRYVVMGSKKLERSGHRVVAYDARGHGASAPAPSAEDYGYAALADDLEAVLDDRGIDRAVLAGASMGAHTALTWALRAPERVAGLVLVTPAYAPDDDGTGTDLDRWDRLSDALRADGVEGFVAAYGVEDVPERWRDTVQTVLRQRLSAHERLDAVADALKAVPRSDPFGAWDELAPLRDVPAAVVADRDEADPGHPLAVGERYAEVLGAELVVEEEGRSPIAWQGGQLSGVIARVAQGVD